MCLIIASQLGELPKDSLLRDANQDNPDGWGICKVQNGRIAVEKGWNTASLIAASHRCENLPYIIHMRFATHGTVNRRNTHPFKIAPGLFMAHNGMLNISTASNPELSDTAHYANLISSLLADVPDWWNMPSFISDLEEDIGLCNKLAFLRDTGELRLVNKLMGEEEGSIWYSNTNSHPVSKKWYYGAHLGLAKPLVGKGEWWEKEFVDDGLDLEESEVDAKEVASQEADYQAWIAGNLDRLPTFTGIKSYSEHARPNVDCPMELMDEVVDDWWNKELRLQNHALKTRLG